MAVTIRRLFPALLCILFAPPALSQDGSTSAIRGAVTDVTGASIAGARIIAVHPATSTHHETTTGADGTYAVQMLQPGQYRVEVFATGMTAQSRTAELEIGSGARLDFVLSPATVDQSVEVSAGTTLVETENAEISHVIDEKTIADTPLNGRRFSDLALLTPGTAQDPRSLTSGSNGDLAVGGLRGFNTNFLVDGADFNNGFYSQARGRYRAPYQFSNEVVQEFRVSSNSYTADSGRSGGPVVNVVTRSGGNQLHGTAFHYVRDSRFNAQHPFSDVKPADRQNQWGFTVGGPIRRRRLFFFAGWDEHRFRDPGVVRFLNGQSEVVPSPGSPGLPGDYDPLDQALVEARSASLSQLGGTYHTRLNGHSAFLKLNANLSPLHNLNLRFSNSTLGGENNVFFDPARPITFSPVSGNGTERVRTDSVLVSATSAFLKRLTSHARVQFSRDLQESQPNSEDVLTVIDGITDGYGRSSILPRRTREHRIHAAETMILSGPRHDWKFGADVLLTWTYNYFPSGFGGKYIFDNIRVNPFDFTPMTYGERLTPLRAWAHGVPSYYSQDFGRADSHPDTREYAAFVQDSVRFGHHLALTAGVRYDRQSFGQPDVRATSYWSTAGRMPDPANNLAPRVGFAVSLGHQEPWIVRGGYGWFYSRVPSIYASAIETSNGMNRFHVSLRNEQGGDHIPSYPSPLVACPVSATECMLPPEIALLAETQVSSFSPDFRTPMTQQASLSVEKQVGRLVVTLSGLHVHGERLIRTRDVNLPEPIEVLYPVYGNDETFSGDYLPVASFGAWETTRSLSCPFPPCIADPARPVPQIGAINVFETVGTSIYDALTVSARKRMAKGFSFRLAYTFAKAIDDGQDAVRTSGSMIQNSYAARNERALSTIDQRQRLAFQMVVEPRPFSREHPLLARFVNDWKIASLLTAGSGRPMSARVSGDPNGDRNWNNDRLPGVGRNSFIGPDYVTEDLRLSRQFRFTERYRLEVLVEAFNLCNRNNKRVTTTDDGFNSTAADFELGSYQQGANRYPARYRLDSRFLAPNDAYAARQLQFSVRFRF